ncbi:DUF6511 domain-containing protein [Magnetococcales bacterium HHB-1]
MSIAHIWTQQRTHWHQPQLGFFTLPVGTKGQRITLKQVPHRERKSFRNILRKHKDHILVFIAGQVRAVSTSILMGKQTMVDPTNLEQDAMNAAIKPLGEYVASIGMNRPLADYSKAEISTLIEVVVTSFQDHIADFGSGSVSS